MHELSVGGVFDGVGLLAYGLHLAGLEHAWLCEVDPWRRGILEQRWPGIPVYDDVRGVGAASAVRVDLIAGGFPCKGASTAGLRNGFDHAETVLWREMARTVRELRPRYVLVENVANILTLHDGAVWGEVVGDLAALGYDIVWDCLPAAAVGAPHLRDRVFAIATHADGRDEGAIESAGCERAGRPIASRGASPAPDTGGETPCRDGQGRAGTRRRDHARAGAQAPADAQRDPVRQQPEPERRSGGPAGARRDSEDAAYADGVAAQPATGERRGEPGRAGEPVAVEWGDFEPAIRRWERALGRPAGEPLLSGVADRSARRLVRSRLSALGDGVQVQLGQLVGAHILALERRRLGR